jgi:hypothetical protein
MSLTPFCCSKTFLFLGLLCLLLVGCKQTEQVSQLPPQGTLFENPTTPQPASPTPSPTKKYPIVAVPRMTVKPTRTQTPTVDPAIRATSLAGATNTALAEQATRDYEATIIVRGNAHWATVEAIFPNCGAPNNTEYSPDGKWVAIECINLFTGIYNLENPSITWQVPYYEIFGYEYDDGNHYGNLRVTHWSADSRYVYLSPLPCCMDGCLDYIHGMALLRLDTLTGKVTFTLQSGGDLKFYNVSFSKDDQYMAYFRLWLDHPILNIQNLITGKDQHIPLGEQFSDAGYVVWSPDQNRVVFSARSGEECADMIYYVVMVNLADLSQTIISEGVGLRYYPVDWLEDNRIILMYGHYGDYYTYDLGTGEITPFEMPVPTENP